MDRIAVSSTPRNGSDKGKGDQSIVMGMDGGRQGELRQPLVFERSQNRKTVISGLCSVTFCPWALSGALP